MFSVPSVKADLIASVVNRVFFFLPEELLHSSDSSFEEDFRPALITLTLIFLGRNKCTFHLETEQPHQEITD